MSVLNDYKVAFDNSYQEIFQKTLVAKEIMNTRFEPMLTYGGSITRVAMDLSGVLVRTVVRGAASTIDSVTDTAEALTINLEKEIAFYLSDGEVTQTGPLKAMQFAGKELARKLSLDLDGRCFAEIRNALYSFDNGDLTTGASTGTAITLSSTTVPQMVSRLSAKLRNKNHQEVMTNMALVVDSYAASDIDQYLLSKSIDLAGAVFKNGYAGPVKSAELYISEQLPSTIVITSSGVVSDGDTLTINGVVLTMKTALTPTAGQILIGAAATNTIQNIAAFINDPTTTTVQGVALTSASDIASLKGIAGVATSATVLTLNGTGTGRITATETLANFVITSNTLHGYYGKKGAIDLVVQDSKEVDIRQTSDRRGNNIFSSYLAGLKTFADGAKKFLKVDILVA
jgi:hypothetical protein